MLVTGLVIGLFVVKADAIGHYGAADSVETVVIGSLDVEVEADMIDRHVFVGGMVLRQHLVEQGGGTLSGLHTPYYLEEL